MSQSENQGQNRRLLDSLEDSFYFPNMIIEESNHNPMKLEKLLDIANQIQEEEESFEDDENYSIDEDGTEWFQDDDGYWWYRPEGEPDWLPWEEDED